jgi:WD40 repeat protein
MTPGNSPIYALVSIETPLPIFLTAGLDNSIKVWNLDLTYTQSVMGSSSVKDQKEGPETASSSSLLVGSLDGHEGPVFALSIMKTPNPILVSVSGDRSIKVWQLHALRCLFTISGIYCNSFFKALELYLSCICHVIFRST